MNIGYWVLALMLNGLLGCWGGTMMNAQETDNLRHRTENELRRVVERNDAPGIAYFVVTADSVLFEGTAGTTDEAGGGGITRNTMFMAYSTTKALTAIASLRLAQQGTVYLDEPLSTYLPDNPYGDRITIRMLLAHTAGVPHPMPLDWFFVEGEPLDRKAEFVRVLEKADEPVSEPGAEYRYSNLGYWLLESAIEAATGESFADVVTTEIFAPLDIENGASFSIPSAARLATGHVRKWSIRTPVFYLMTPSRYWATSANGWSRFERLIPYGLGYGGLYISPVAFAAILQDLLRPHGVLLSLASKEALFAPQHLNDGRATGDALGWTVGKLEGARYLGKQGGGIGFHGNIRIYPDIGIATVYSANSTQVSTGPIDSLSDTLDAPFVADRKTG